MVSVLLLASVLHAQSSPTAADPVLPKWLQLGVEFRGRFEGGTANNYVSGDDDFYYLHRVRSQITIRPADWLRFFIQPQTVEAPGRRKPVPDSQADHFDFHQLHMDVAGNGERHWSFRLGRQELNFGAQRLVGSANWGNTSRSFDGARLSYETPQTRVDWFASTVVKIDRQNFDRFTRNTQLHGFHVSSKSWIPKATVEPYLFWKADPLETSETGVVGRSAHATIGFRAEGPLPRRFDYSIETAFQKGHLGGEQHRGWAGYYTLGYRVNSKPQAPRIFGAYSYASGDPNYGDGHRGTFDMLYPTNHAFYGWANRHALRNLREVMAGVVWRPTPKWVVNYEYHTTWLANRQDFYYNFNGRAVFRNPNATSSHLDQEVDVYSVYNMSRRVQLVLGFGRIFPGSFLKQSRRDSPVFVPYLQWRYTL